MALEKLKPSRTMMVLYALAVLLAFGLGYLLRGGTSRSVPAATTATQADAPASTWTCSMHPQIRLPKPGKCPICLMDLIPIDATLDDGAGGTRRLTMSPAARKLAEIRTQPVRYRDASVDVRLVGKVAYDETRLSYVSAWVPGRLDRLYVDYTGIAVRKGDHMVSLYSPELLAAQQELLEAGRAAVRLQTSDIEFMRDTARATLDAARDKLRLWALTASQIAAIETRGAPTEHTTIYAPEGGIVIEKYVNEGMYVDVGTRIYSIADLSSVWVLLDGYESDLKWIRYGQDVQFETEALPGETFNGRVSFIDPMLNAKTRTLKIRVNVDNLQQRLKPEMFVRAIVRAQVAAGGRVMDPKLSGKWICPMHPGVVADRPGACSACGMDLVSSESLGYVAVDPTRRDLVIPASAVLMTGKRAVVYVEIPGAEQPTFEGREVVLGPRAGDSYIVQSGLGEGERVAVNGAFKIDSALQILARPSMMSPDPSAPHSQLQAQAGSAKFAAGLTPIYDAYFRLQQGLAADAFEVARKAYEELLPAIAAAPAERLDGEGRARWLQLAGELATLATTGADAKSIAAARDGFDALSNAMILVEESFGHVGQRAHFRMHCPMAFDNRGADWLQASDKLENPYFGASMLRCGSIVRQHPATASTGDSTPHRHDGR